MARYSAISRLFAFLALIGAIVPVASASRDPWILPVGIPGLALGYYYSWRKRNTVAKHRTLLLLLLMILLSLYLGKDMVLYGITDRLLLSRYLVYGLVLGSFDLLKRRNVLASLILGALLLVLISELALNPWFLAFPVVFTVLALIAVAMSRVEAESSQAVVVGDLRWLTAVKVWLGFAAVTLMVSAVFFLLMPRLASREVAQASWLPSRLDLSLGGFAMLPSKPSASVSPGIFPSYQEGSSEGYAALGYVGSSADKAVMQVRSRISSYWRGAILDEYDGRGWLPTRFEIRLLDENRREFSLPDSRVNLIGERVYWQAYYMLTDQPNALFTGYNPGRIYLPEIGQVFLERGAFYRALSVVPYLLPERLRYDRIVFEDVDHLKLPPISERTAALAESVVQGGLTDYDRAVRLERFLLTSYPYRLDVKPLPAGCDAVDYFLFEQQAGYCAHFATAMAVMARQVGLPARVAVGYLPGVIDPMTGAHTVRAGDAHAWVEIHFRQHGWVAFDPTPRGDASKGFAAGRNWLYFGLEGFTGVTFASMVPPLLGDFSLGSLSLPGWLWAVLPVAGVTLTVLFLFLSRRRVRIKEEAVGYSILDGEPRRVMLNLYRKMLALLVRKGLPVRQPYQPLYEYAAIVCPQVWGGQEMIDWLTQAASSAAYDAKPFNPSTVVEARQKLSALKQALTSRR